MIEAVVLDDKDLSQSLEHRQWQSSCPDWTLWSESTASFGGGVDNCNERTVQLGAFN